MMTTESEAHNADIQSLRRAGRGDPLIHDVDKLVRQELRENYRGLSPTGTYRCHICSQPDAKHVVNSGLAHGLTYAEVHRSLADINNRLPKKKRISSGSVERHARDHFDLTNPALAVYRRIVEKRAREDEQDIVTGIGTIVNALGYLEVMGQKGFETLMSEDTVISPELGMSAMVKLHDLTSRGSTDRELAELRRKVSLLGAAVRDTIPQELWPTVLARMEELNSGALPIDAEVEEVEDDDDGYDQDEEYDPVIDTDTDDELETDGYHPR